MRNCVNLTEPQFEFFNRKTRYSAFIAGYGSGKSYVGCCRLANHFCEHPNVDAGYFAPTYPQIRDIFYPTVEEVFSLWGFNVKVKQSSHEVEVYRGSKFYGVIRCRSMDRPETIVGFKLGHALIDEIDVMHQDKATVAWRKIIARMRYKSKGLRNGVDVTTTPEGFRFVYNQFVKQVRENPELEKFYGIVHASTYSNARNLPEGYIESLVESYPANLVDAYINGQFVNLTSGSVYPAYSRAENASTEVVIANEPLFIGMDFNVGKMAAVVHVLRNGKPHAVDEIVSAYDTPDMIRQIKERYWRYENGRYLQTCAIRIYPDASGQSRKSVNASTSDLALLRDAGFVVCVGSANPPVKDRVNSMNALFCNAQGERRYFVNLSRCPSYAEALEQQAWGKDGEPDKTSGYDHIVDAGGYYIVKEFPIMKRPTSVTRTTSLRW